MHDNFVNDVRARANGNWQSVLERLSIPTNRSEGPCPTCGGKTRYRFDDKDGRGTYYCSHCGAGTGLDLVMKVNQCGAREAAEMVADAMALPMPEPRPARKGAPKSVVQPIADKVAALMAKANPGQSAYLTSKGLQWAFPLLSDGSLLMALTNSGGATTGAQVIKPDGSKRLVSGTVKKGSFCVVNSVESTETVIIGEGLATVLSVHAMRPDAMIVASVDAGNLHPVALVMRQQHPDAQIVIAADNDIKPGEPNTGRVAAEKAAAAVSGWLSLPPTDHKADWNDYHQQHGLEAATTAFNRAMYQAEGKRTKKHLLPTRTPTGGLDELSTGEILSPDEIQILENINRVFTHITIGGKHKVVSLKPSQAGGVSHVFEDLSQFQHYFHHKPRVARKLAGTAWQAWAGKNYKPGGVGFYPIPDKCPADVFNMFEGLALEPVAGDCTPYLEHLRLVICAGNAEAYHYLVQWMAHIIQKPDEKPAVAIVMKSIPGAGKGTTVKPLLSIFGQYAAHINGAAHIAGRFNAMLANKLLVFADEVTIRTPSEADKLKAIISEATFNLERKGIDAEPMPNFARLIFASNSTQVLQAGIRERRYLVLEPTPEKAQSREYFNNLHGWLSDNGAGKLLGYLQTVDISTFDPQRAPQTDALREEILQGLSGVELFLYSELVKEPPFSGEVRLFAGDMVNRFMAWSLERGEKVKDTAARSLVGKALAQLGLKKFGRPGRSTGIYYELPDAETLQQAFARLIGMGGHDVF
ncbi:TPA: DUF5906 domain-containing protein [Enterobacter ludwigii]